MQQITLKKIAQTLGISISTVSRALKNHPDISSSTKQKVKELAESLDYEPNAHAINLRTQNNRSLGLMIPSANISFYASFLSAIEEECRKSDRSLVIMQSMDDPETEKNILKIFRQNRVSGVFACLSPDSDSRESVKKLMNINIPVVIFDKVDESHPYQVSLSDKNATELVAHQLIKKEKKHILAILGNPDLSITKNRLQYFQSCFSKDSGTKIEIVFCENSNNAYQFVYDYFSSSSKPDAVFCMSDEILVGCMKAIQALKISYPKQTGIIAMSDGFFPNLYMPKISYVETSGYLLGKETFNCMNDILNKVLTSPKTINLPCQFIKGESL